MGADIKRRNPRSKIAKRFFLKKTTHTIRHPRRDIIGPFWRKWRHRTIDEVQQVFRAKLAGRRV
jgi:hypothetical protein